jgi:hypothetical protein
MSFRDPSLQTPAPTGGIVFNRKEPKNPAGEVQPILNRRLEVRGGVKNSVFNEGKDFTSLGDRHRFKYRIPDDSVVNKVGDCKLGLCFGYRLTAAQWIWTLNLICFTAHTTMVFLTAYLAWWSKDLDKYDSNPYDIKIYRVTAKWTNESSQVYEFAMEPNGVPLDIAWATLSFFLISAVFHLFSMVAGLFEHTWFWYWRCVHTPSLPYPSPSVQTHVSHIVSALVFHRQIDDAFCWWRYVPHPLTHFIHQKSMHDIIRATVVTQLARVQRLGELDGDAFGHLSRHT